MTFKSFGGIGVEIMRYREEFEVQHEQADNLLKQISDQSERVSRLQDDLLQSVQKAMHGDLQLNKLAGSTEFGKRLTITKGLVDAVRDGIDKLKKLHDECRTALDRAWIALPDYTKFATNGRLDVPPGGRSFFIADKAIGNAANIMSPFEPPAPRQPPVDLMATLFDTQLSRRFQR
jgi:hypothetical protein